MCPIIIDYLYKIQLFYNLSLIECNTVVPIFNNVKNDVNTLLKYDDKDNYNNIKQSFFEESLQILTQIYNSFINGERYEYIVDDFNGLLDVCNNKVLITNMELMYNLFCDNYLEIYKPIIESFNNKDKKIIINSDTILNQYTEIFRPNQPDDNIKNKLFNKAYTQLQMDSNSIINMFTNDNKCYEHKQIFYDNIKYAQNRETIIKILYYFGIKIHLKHHLN